jgi:phage protein D
MAEQPISEDPRYRARPTVRIDDQEQPSITHRVNAFKVTEQAGGMSSLELRLSNEPGEEAPETAAFAFEDERDLALGSRITIYSGDEQNPREIFRGVVSGIEAEFHEDGQAEILVLAEDALQGGRLARRSKTHDDLKLSSLANDVARSLSLTPKVTGFTDSIGVQVQLNESDLAFLRRMLERYDGDLQVVGAELHVTPRSQVNRGTVELAARGGQLRRARFVADLAHQVTEVTTAGWDVNGAQRITGTSSGSNLGPGTGRTGSSVLGQKLNIQRSEHIGNPPVASQTEAQAVADAAFDQRARRFVIAHGTAEGNAQLRVGTSVKITGTSKRFDNTYYIVRACHRFDLERGYETDFEAECAYLGNP